MASTSPQAGSSLFDQVQQSAAPLQPGAGGGVVEADDDVRIRTPFRNLNYFIFYDASAYNTIS